MPIYEYRCDQCGHEFEEMRRITDETLPPCHKCASGATHRLISRSAFHLKGTGWYVTDYGGKKESPSDGNGNEEGGESDGKRSESESSSDSSKKESSSAESSSDSPKKESSSAESATRESKSATGESTSA